MFLLEYKQAIEPNVPLMIWETSSLICYASLVRRFLFDKWLDNRYKVSALKAVPSVLCNIDLTIQNQEFKKHIKGYYTLIPVF